MSLAYYVSKENHCIITGLSSDTKPVSPPDNWIFLEENTTSRYYSSGGSWVRVNQLPSIDGNALKYVRVNADATALEYTAPSGGGDLLSTNNLSDLANAGTARTNLGIGNIDNTSDANKPVSTAQQTALDGKANSLGADDNYMTDAEKTKLASLNPYTLVATLANDQATGANTNPVTLTGLVFNYEANSKYRIWFMGAVSPTAATTGCGFQFDLSSAVTSILVKFDHQLANTGTLSGGSSIADDASAGVSSGMPGTGTYPVSGEALLITTGNTGTAQLRFRAEVAAVTTCKAGFTLIVEKIA